jgi:predicted glycogen debranching enzyme
MESTWNDQREWLETDGLGGFASGTVGGIRTRRYHGLLLASLTPPTNRFMLVNGVEATVTTPAGAFPISTQRYDGQFVHPDGFKHLRRFSAEPWPMWTFELPDGTTIRQELFVRHGAPITAMSWRLIEPRDGVTLAARPLLSGRDLHALHHENDAFRFDATEMPRGVRWQPYPSVPGVSAYANGRYEHAPLWYRQFFYQEEWLRGFDATEDLASPGTFTFDLSAGEASLILAADGAPTNLSLDTLRESERHRRGNFATSLHRAADQYVVRRGEGRSIIAGYPWFGDWGRDTFIAMRGLCLATGRLDVARDVLLAWAPHVSQGMLPNRFPDGGEEPEYNSVDASLWYVITVFEFLRAADRAGFNVTRSNSRSLLAAAHAILTGYADGTWYGIRADADGLLAAGSPGQQLTWMDARANGREVTPRCGKPVEVQALWLNALAAAANLSSRWRGLLERGRLSFAGRFWNPATGSLFDVIDVDHQPGHNDGSLRPNQIFAVGGLPMALLDGERARRVVDVVERELWTPMGIRTLAQGEPHYAPRYAGGPSERDAVYHQGTAWPWLIGPFVEAWIRVRGRTSDARTEARRRFVAPILRHLEDAGIGHVSEIADGDAPHMPRGCPFQAWSIGELLRLEHDVLKDTPAAEKPPRAARHRSIGSPAMSR